MGIPDQAREADSKQLSGSFRLLSSIVAGNEALVSGGGAYFLQIKFFAQSSSFINNTALEAGCGLYCNYMHGSARTFDLSFFNNTAKSGGGAYIYCSSFVMERSHILGNKAYQIGGGIYAYPGLYGPSNVTFISSVISGNSALQSGGAAFELSNGTFIGSRITHNTAAECGGGVSTVKTSNLTFIASALEYNVAQGSYGGAVLLRPFSNIQIISCTLIGNTALQSYGGTIYASTNCDISISNSTFFDNTAAYT